MDFVFYCSLNLGIGLAQDLDPVGIRQFMERFDERHQRLKENGVILHFLTEKDVPVDMAESQSAAESPYNTPEAKNRVYTFVKSKNQLYRGSTLVQSYVVQRLKASPLKTYCTIAFGGLRRAVRLIR